MLHAQSNMNDLLNNFEKLLDELEFKYLELLNNEQFQTNFGMSVNTIMLELLTHKESSTNV